MRRGDWRWKSGATVSSDEPEPVVSPNIHTDRVVKILNIELAEDDFTRSARFWVDEEDDVFVVLIKAAVVRVREGATVCIVSRENNWFAVTQSNVELTGINFGHDWRGCVFKSYN